jgi:hypothetical protein
LFYNEFWADKVGIPMPPRVAAHYARISARPVGAAGAGRGGLSDLMERRAD